MGGKHGDRQHTGRAVYVLGTACGTLAVAAVVSAVYAVPDPVLGADGAPAATHEDVLVLGEDWSAVDESEPSGGPLQVPTIGEGLREYDEQMEALDAARRAADLAAPPPPPTGNPPAPMPVDPPPPPTDTPAVPLPPIESPAVPPVATGAPTTPPESDPAAPTTDAPVVPENPPVPPEGTEVPTPAVTDPTDTPTVPEPPAVPPEATEAPATPPVTDPPATPTTPPPAPTDTTLSLGEPYDHTDAAGNVDFSITLVAVDTALTCTSPASLPPENGQLVAVQVEVVDAQSPAAGEPPSITAADFGFFGPDGALTEDVDTASAAACLADGQPGPDSPVGGTVVLDVPATDGTIVYRP